MQHNLENHMNLNLNDQRQQNGIRQKMMKDKISYFVIDIVKYQKH